MKSNLASLLLKILIFTSITTYQSCTYGCFGDLLSRFLHKIAPQRYSTIAEKPNKITFKPSKNPAILFKTFGLPPELQNTVFQYFFHIPGLLQSHDPKKSCRISSLYLHRFFNGCIQYMASHNFTEDQIQEKLRTLYSTNHLELACQTLLKPKIDPSQHIPARPTKVEYGNYQARPIEKEEQTVGMKIYHESKLIGTIEGKWCRGPRFKHDLITYARYNDDKYEETVIYRIEQDTIRWLACHTGMSDCYMHDNSRLALIISHNRAMLIPITDLLETKIEPMNSAMQLCFPPECCSWSIMDFHEDGQYMSAVGKNDSNTLLFTWELAKITTPGAYYLPHSTVSIDHYGNIPQKITPQFSSMKALFDAMQ